MSKRYRLNLNNGKKYIYFDTRKQLDDYISKNHPDGVINQGTLPNVEVVGKKPKKGGEIAADEVFGSGNPIWGSKRVDNVRRTLRNNPGALDNWNMLPIFNDMINSSNNFLYPDRNPKVLDLSGKNIKQINDDRYYKAILANEFVERNNNNIRQAKDFANTTDRTIGDKHIPLEDMPYFVGVENGKFKIDSLKNFNPNTTVVPNRYANRGKLKEVISDTLAYPNFEKADSIALEKYPAPSFSDRLLNAVTFGAYTPKTMTKEYIDERTDYANDLAIDLPSDNKLPYMYGITTTGDTLSLYNARDKRILSDENGNALFVNNLSNLSKKQLRELNKSLKKNPRYIWQPDNGRYSHHIFNANRTKYINPTDYSRKNNMFIIGY